MVNRHLDFNHKFEGSSATAMIAKKPWPWRLGKKKLVLLVATLFLVVGVGFLVGKAVITARRVITENTSGSPFLRGILGDVDFRQLKGEGDGRINILLLGMGGDNHPAGNLSDTIIVLSIDPKNKNAAMLSIPRDLYVNTGYGYGKVNTVYAYGEMNKYSSGGGALAKKQIGEILDLPIHYYARLDFEGFRKMVDEVGGVTINVEKSIADYTYPDENMQGYEPFFISKGVHHMNGILALKYARSRHTTSDFDRARRQQQVLSAVREKALKIGFISNPKKISDVLDILGDHLRTDIQLWEMERLYEIVKELNTDTIVNKVIDNSKTGLLVAKHDSKAGYILVPRTGDFSEIRNFAHSIFTDSYIKGEKARLVVMNGTTRYGLAHTVSNMLKSYGYNVVKTKNAKSRNYTNCVIYDYTNGAKPYTVQYLRNRFSAEVKTFSQLPSDQSEIVLVLGSYYQVTNNYYQY